MPRQRLSKSLFDIFFGPIFFAFSSSRPNSEWLQMTSALRAFVIGIERPAIFVRALVSSLTLLSFIIDLSGGASRPAQPFWRESTGTQGSLKPHQKANFGIRAWTTRLSKILLEGVERVTLVSFSARSGGS